MRIHYDQTIIVRRLKTSSGNKRSLVATATADASIQPLGKEGSQIDTGVFGSRFIGYVEDFVPAQKGDQIEDENGFLYTVFEVNLRDFGAFPFKELILTRES